MATTSAALSSLFPTMIPNPSFNALRTHNSSLLLVAFPSSATAALASKRTVPFRDLLLKNSRHKKCWKIQAESTEAAITRPLETAQEIMAAKDDGVSTIISTLLFAAFVGLSILTIGVIYIAVTDFLTKREKEKFEKEETARRRKMKKNGKKKAVRAKGGPRGFGQKYEEEEEDDII